LDLDRCCLFAVLSDLKLRYSTSLMNINLHFRFVYFA